MKRTGATSAPPKGPGSRALVWFRRDLRIADNPALVAALSMGDVIPIYIWAPEEEGQFQPGRCSRWWLHHSLAALDADLRALGSRLLCFRASDSCATLTRLAGQLGAGAVLFNHLYDPISMVRDNEVKAGLAAAGIYCQSFNADILREPWEVLDHHGKPFTCYDAFWSAHSGLAYPPTPPLPLPAALPPLPPEVEAAAAAAGAVPLKGLGIISQEEEMSNAQLDYHWHPGSAGAHKLLDDFVCNGRLQSFDKDRAKTDCASTSRLSPHIHHGEISVRHIYYVARHRELEWARSGEGGTSVQDFLRQLGYREYSRYLSFHFPFTHERSLLEHLRAVPWRFDQRLFKAWRQGRTGYPLVDAAMREVWSTGWMHNRMRVVAASFMVKNLLLPWQWGLKHYWDALLDADLECDALGWQYVSGCMADAHEFSYTIDHHSEAKRFDPDGNYVRRWLPVLARLPVKYIHEPWAAPEAVLADAGVDLGVNYPYPVLSQEDSMAALAAADAVVQQCMRSSGAAEASGQCGATMGGPFRPATDAEPEEAERMFAEHYRNHVLFSEPPQAQRAEGSGASEDVQSNIVLPAADGAARRGRAAGTAGTAQPAGSDLVSVYAPLPADAARSIRGGRPADSSAGTAAGATSAAPLLPEQPPARLRPGTASPAPQERLAPQADALWQPLHTMAPPGAGGSGAGGSGTGGSGGGTAHATLTGVSLGVVPSLSAGIAAVPQAAGAALLPPRPPRVRRQLPQGEQEEDQPLQQQVPARGQDARKQQQQQQQRSPPQPQVCNEAQAWQCGGQGSSNPRSGSCSDTVQQAAGMQSLARSLAEVGTVAPASAHLQQQQQQQQQSSHKRQRAHSPPLPGSS